MEIHNSRRMLVLGPPNSEIFTLLQALTGSSPQLEGNNDIAGLSHSWQVRTEYYRAEIPIWIDEIADIERWGEEMLRPEAKEVLSVLGAFVFCFRKPVQQADFNIIQTCLATVAEVIRRGCGATWDGGFFAVAMPQSMTPSLSQTFEEWEDLCRRCSCEFIDFEMKGRNEFGEPTGIERLREALEATEWFGDEDHGDLNSLEDDEGAPVGFDLEATEMQNELLGLKGSLNDEASVDSREHDEPNDEREVEKLELMMRKMIAAKGIIPFFPGDGMFVNGKLPVQR
ncbi:MAG: hypothetical protein M1817_005645 [Caeruleum heppii]|nr:MAG: hypothetical protein M1817_005645 [Caeruleum heppii]